LDEEEEHGNGNCPSEAKVAQAHSTPTHPSVGEKPPVGLLIVEPPTALPTTSASLQSCALTAASLHHYELFANQISLSMLVVYLLKPVFNREC